MASNAIVSRIAIDTVVFATDFSPSAKQALPHALAIARRCHAHLILAHIRTGPGSRPPQPEVLLRDENLSSHLAESEVRNELAQFCSKQTFDGLPHETVVGYGEVWNGLSQIIRERSAGLLVVGTRGLGGLKKLRLGSVAEDVVRSALCPVLIIGPNVAACASDRFQRVLFATNFAEASSRALHYVLAFVEEDRATLTMMHILPETARRQAGEQLRRRYSQQLAAMLPAGPDFCCPLKLVVEIGKPAEAIVRQAATEKSDLIVLGAHAASRPSTFLPSTLHYVVSHACCPVLATCAE